MNIVVETAFRVHILQDHYSYFLQQGEIASITREKKSFFSKKGKQEKLGAAQSSQVEKVS